MKLSKHLHNILTKVCCYITIRVAFLKIYRFSRATILVILLLTFSDIKDGGRQSKYSHIVRITSPTSVFLVSIYRFSMRRFKIDFDLLRQSYLPSLNMANVNVGEGQK